MAYKIILTGLLGKKNSGLELRYIIKMMYEVVYIYVLVSIYLLIKLPI